MKNVLLINAALTILFLSDTYGGRTHDKRIAEATPYPLPAGSRLLQDLGFLAFMLDQVEIIMPTKKPRGRALTRAQKAANRRIARRRVRVEHVNSSVKRCRIVHDTSRLRKAGVRDLVMELCCALHNFRVRLHPVATNGLIEMNSIDFLVLDGSPQALDEDVIQRPPAPVHADLNPTRPKPLGKRRARELGALIGVENFRLGVYERAFQGADAEVTVEGG